MGKKGHLPPLGNAQMGICYCYEVYARVPKSSMTVLSVYLYCTYEVCDSYSCYVQSDVAINTFCQDQLTVIIGFVLLNTNVLMRIFL